MRVPRRTFGFFAASAAQLTLAAALVLALAATAGCPTLPEPVLCGQIPVDGCPAGRGGSCDDTSCARLCDCVDGHWTTVETCAAPDGGAGAGGTGGASPDGGSCTPAQIDTTGKATHCMPDLEEPDCPVEAAEGCVETACFTGCADFFLCTKDGWVDVAYCTDDGALVVTQP